MAYPPFGECPLCAPRGREWGAKRRKTAHPSPKSDGEKARMRQKRAVWNAHVAVSLQENDELWKHRDG